MSAREDFGSLLVHTASVATPVGTSARGPVLNAASSPIACLIEDSTQLVRTPDGRRVQAASMLFAQPEYANLFAVGAQVSSDRLAVPGTVITASRNEYGALGLPDHVLVALA